MAVYLIRTEFANVSGIPRDGFTSNFHFQTDEGDHTPEVGEALIGHVAAAYITVQAPGTVNPASLLSAEIARTPPPVGKAYDGDGVGLAGSPVAIAPWASMPNAGDPTSMPSEVAKCLSYRSDFGTAVEFGPDGADPDTKPDRPRSRHRGRSYFGPLISSTSTKTSAAPTMCASTLRNVLFGLGVFLGNPTDSVLTAVNAAWVVKGKDGSFPVVETSVTDVFDTQRRRGARPSSRLTHVV